MQQMYLNSSQQSRNAMDIAHEHMLQIVLYDWAGLENGTQVGRMMGSRVERRTFAGYIDKGTAPMTESRTNWSTTALGNRPISAATPEARDAMYSRVPSKPEHSVANPQAREQHLS